MKSISYEESFAFDPESTNLAAIPTEDLERSLTTLEQLQREYFPVGDKERENFETRANNLKNRLNPDTMNNEKFTPGKWTAIDDTIWTIKDGYNSMVADFRQIQINGDEQTANCILSAAAPDMYEALNEIESTLRNNDYWSDGGFNGEDKIFEIIEIALAKANPINQTT